MAGRFVRVKDTPEAREAAMREVDWARVDATTDEDIAAQIASDPDTAPEATDAETASVRVQWARRKTGLSQSEFARRYRVPLRTLQEWEQGRREPGAAVLAYLTVVERAPEAVAKALAA